MYGTVIHGGLMPLGIRGPLLLYNQGVVVLRFAVRIESSATCSF